jgi:alanyl-tRNA synthetase
MQQHSGQHVLSQAFVVVLGLETVAVHIGARSGDCTLDLQAPLAALSPANLERVELAANEIVFENRPIRCYELGYDELGRTPLRKPPKKSADGKVRIVEVQDFDWSACGGTHVRSTAEIGLIKLLKAEKRGNDTRIVFRCGGRALQDYARINKDVTKLADTFSVARYDLADTVDRLRAEFQSTRKALESAQTALLEYEARELIATSLTAPQTNGSHARVIQKVFENREMTELRLLAKLLTAQGMGGEGVGVVLLGSAGERSALCFARAGGAAGAGDMGAALKLALATLGNGAKGGGNSDFAQGGGVPATLAQIIEALKAAKQALNLS